ncbi:MAG: 50S ribosomal protein L10 [Firmicutes bacterium]|nr:50S ribosomal protein L10 [Bacillota bacterium]
MGENRIQKEAEVVEIKKKISEAKSIVLVDYRGLTVKQDTELRNEFRKNKIEYKVLKNTLFSRAFKELGHSGLDKELNGPSAFAFGYEDPILAAKVVADNAKKYNKMSIKAGFYDGKALDAAGVKTLASIPSKPVLVSQLLMLLTTPVRKLAQCCDQIASKKV